MVGLPRAPSLSLLSEPYLGVAEGVNRDTMPEGNFLSGVCLRQPYVLNGRVDGEPLLATDLHHVPKDGEKRLGLLNVLFLDPSRNSIRERLLP